MVVDTRCRGSNLARYGVTECGCRADGGDGRERGMCRPPHPPSSLSIGRFCSPPPWSLPIGSPGPSASIDRDHGLCRSAAAGGACSAA